MTECGLCDEYLYLPHPMVSGRPYYHKIYSKNDGVEYISDFRSGLELVFLYKSVIGLFI